MSKVLTVSENYFEELIKEVSKRVVGKLMRKGEIYKWRREADPDNIHMYISDHVSKVYREVAIDLKKRKDEAENEQLMKYWHQVEKTFKIYTSKLYRIFRFASERFA